MYFDEVDVGDYRIYAGATDRLNSYGYVAAPAGLGGPLQAMPVRATALWLQEFFLDHEEAFLRWLPPGWHRDFEPWLDRQTA